MAHPMGVAERAGRQGPRLRCCRGRPIESRLFNRLGHGRLTLTVRLWRSCEQRQCRAPKTAPSGRKMPDPYGRHRDDERALELALWAGTLGALGVGFETVRRALFWRIQHPPPRIQLPGERRQSMVRLIRTRQSATILRSAWWTGIWADFERQAGSILARLSLKAASPLVRRYSSRITPARVLDEVLADADDYARRLVLEIRKITEGALPVGLEAVARQRPATSEIRKLLAVRLGPAPAQVEQINRWEARAIREGKLSREEILIELRRRGRSAIKQRVDPIASDALVRRASEARIQVLRAAGRLVSSGNPLDDRTTPADRDQTLATRANPTPAGGPWALEAPHRGLPPYHRKCRCWVEDAGEGL